MHQSLSFIVPFFLPRVPTSFPSKEEITLNSKLFRNIVATSNLENPKSEHDFIWPLSRLEGRSSYPVMYKCQCRAQHAVPQTAV